jgi:hypothetical protein
MSSIAILTKSRGQIVIGVNKIRCDNHNAKINANPAYHPISRAQW